MPDDKTVTPRLIEGLRELAETATRAA